MLIARLVRRFEERAAVRAEHVLKPTWRTRLDRVPARRRDRRALRAERRARHHDPGPAIAQGPGRAWGFGRTFTRPGGPPRF